MKNLSEKALLVNLTISQWTGKKYDKKVSKQIERDHNAHNAGKFNKTLIAEDELKKIQSISNTARSFLRDNTLPWGDNGDRLLPSTNYFEFISIYRKHKDYFNLAVNNFIQQYPSLKAEAKRRLNGMYQETDYPPTHVMKSKFNIDISFMPISDMKDFRLEIDDTEVQNLKSQIELEINNRILQTTNDMWLRIKETVGHMVEKLSEKDPIFRDTLIENIRDLIEILPRLNFTNDQNITKAIQSMKDLLVAPDSLRNNVQLRNQKAREAKAILDKVSDFI